MTERAPSAGPIAVVWFKSSYSGGEGNECIEVAHFRTRVGVRDSKSPDRAIVSLPIDAWVDFVSSVKDGGLSDGPSMRHSPRPR
ncbi:DUF397 domain-containing protein [Streptomyces antimycoticus]|uniref:DUF397 domain-containing protein n=1 Tax=Streptomyces mordarskii TaxID=1226758 RepID=A0ABP3NKX1_9ACTN